ncbi:MAG: hypothetical protein BWY92_00723 [Firmicutes bacterium ADurb.BinA052]|nr:MAG: hypothetical protein BWY92_00723 [Firmicutes bacterium ADurb.BinA052]
MPPALFLRQHVYLSRELGMRRNRPGLRQHLAALHLVAVDAAEQATDVVAGLALVKQLAEHLNAGYDGLLGVGPEPYDLDFLTHLDDTALNPAGDDRAAPGDGEHVLDRHQERLIGFTRRLREVAVACLNQLPDLSAPLAVLLAAGALAGL